MSFQHINQVGQFSELADTCSHNMDWVEPEEETVEETPTRAQAAEGRKVYGMDSIMDGYGHDDDAPNDPISLPIPFC